MKLLTTSFLFLSVGISGCVSNQAIYADYGDLACGQTTTVVEGHYWPTVVNFDFDTKSLDKAQQRELDKAAQLLIMNPTLNIAVIGSADYSGKTGYNDKLAKARAVVVARYLEQQGVSSHRIITLGTGSREPFIISNNKTENRVNRRTQLILLGADFNPVSMQYNSVASHSSAK
ncbi:OmpA family protein [Photobacterium toruni]|uniref:OmpA family protein n=1 Tax=Photobacterium toruni TaxID=1935446 RepID=A0A1T4UKB3_9GAMM|nr:OmpA family protein [Photobacterium toruni]MEC6813830.1 OmpA family protein [Photobacterium toruni]MEC6830304.1 OmpA family protein [Photobacterium toruni]SKA53129.1 Outer membrane lipoprotein Omp16 precursor [Photobacterium toruni]